MLNKKFIIIGFVVLILVLLGNPFFVVNEYEQAVITQFGDPVGDPVTEAGLHLKVPFIQKVTYFDKRILEWDGTPSQIPTNDKKYILIDTTARWKIVKPLEFYQTVTYESGAQSRLDDIIGGAIRDIVPTYNLVEVVRSSNRLLDTDVDIKRAAFKKEEVMVKISHGRDKLRKEILAATKDVVSQFGIKLVDVRIKRVNYIEKVRRKVYDRMVSERKRAAAQYRSEGKGKKDEIKGRTQREYKKIISSAYEKSQGIKGKADKQATKIYASAYKKDAGFFAFLRTLDAYADSIDEDSILILTTDAEYFEYLQSSLNPIVK